MKKVFGLFLGLGLIVMLIPISLSSQEVSAVDSLFNRGVNYYRNGEYKNALQMMVLLDRIYENHVLTTGSLLMQGKSLYKMKEYRKSLRTFGKIIKEHQNSQYYDDALYGIASVYYRQNLYKETVKQLMKLVDMGGDKRLLRKAAQLSSAIMDYRLDLQLMKELLEEVTGEKGKAAVTLRLAQREMNNKRFQSAKRMLQDFVDQYPDSHYIFQLEQLLSKAEKLGKGVVKLGIILPITGPLAEDGNRLLTGIQYAVDLHNNGGKASVELIVKDSQSRIVNTIKAAQELCEDEEIVAIIGELESDLTAALAAVAHQFKIPVISPTATLDGITSISPMVFQVNGNRKIQAETIAKYAVSGLGLNRFAVLAPADEYGQSMSESFVNTVNKLGGEVLIEKWYFEEGSEHLGPQFKEIRKAGIQRLIDDSLLVIIEDEEIWEEMNYENQPVLEDIFHVNQTLEELVDSTALAVTTIDGLFLPVQGQDLPFVMPQIASFNLETKIFGGSYWNDPKTLEDNRRYVEGVYFISDYYVDPFSYTYIQFRDSYRVATGQTPEKMDVVGYDIANLFLSIAGETALPREDIRDLLAGVDGFSGLHANVIFEEDRVNHSVSLLQYLGGKIIQIK